jgi:hypothetical protein
VYFECSEAIDVDAGNECDEFSWHMARVPAMGMTCLLKLDEMLGVWEHAAVFILQVCTLFKCKICKAKTNNVAHQINHP